MRVSTVFSVVALGGLLGAAAIIVPLNATNADLPRTWFANVGELATRTNSEGSSALTTSSVTKPNSKPQTASEQGSVKAATSPWAAQVVVPEERVTVRLTSSRATTDEQRTKVALELQQELRRVGCFEGNVDGEWNAPSKAAMAAFLNKVDASLPHDDPDYVLLTLVQGHIGKACGLTCPAGQQSTASGKCTAPAVQAQSGTSKAKAMAAAGVAAAASAAGAASVASASPVVPVPQLVTRQPARAEKPVAALSDNPTEGKSPATSVLPPKPVLPGRMSVGGPVPPPLALGDNNAEQGLPKPATRPATEQRIVKAERSTDDAAPASRVTAPVTATPEPARQDGPAAATPRNSRPLSSNGHTTPAVAPPLPAAPPKRTVTILRPQPVYVAPPPRQASNASQRQRRMVYDLFQNPARNN